MDMDSTLVNEEGIDLLAAQAGVGEEVARLTSEAMAGELDFSSSLRQRVSLLKGHSSALLEGVTQSLSLTEGAPELISTLRSRGWRVGVVSGGFHEIIDPFLAPLGIDFIRANHFSIAEGVLTGEVIDPIIGPAEKALALEEFAHAHGIELSETVAVGDGANDRNMLRMAGLGIAFCAKEALKEVADVVVERRDLRILLDSI
jgi:phosphoserine phosphatase